MGGGWGGTASSQTTVCDRIMQRLLQDQSVVILSQVRSVEEMWERPNTPLPQLAPLHGTRCITPIHPRKQGVLQSGGGRSPSMQDSWFYRSLTLLPHPAPLPRYAVSSFTRSLTPILPPITRSPHEQDSFYRSLTPLRHPAPHCPLCRTPRWTAASPPFSRSPTLLPRCMYRTLSIAASPRRSARRRRWRILFDTPLVHPPALSPSPSPLPAHCMCRTRSTAASRPRSARRRRWRTTTLISPRRSTRP